MESLIAVWYEWLVFVGVFVAAAATIIIWFDAQDNAEAAATLIPKVVAALGLLATLPSLLMVMSVSLALRWFNYANTFAYLGMLGIVLSVGAVLYYWTQVRDTMHEETIIPPTIYPTPTPVTAPPPPMPPPVSPAPPPLGTTEYVNPPQEAAAWLVVRSGKQDRRTLALSNNKSHTLGRDPKKADLVLDDDTVSREHARVQYENGQFVLYDLASKSGTFVNGHRIQRQMLYDSDRLELGRVNLVFKKA